MRSVLLFLALTSAACWRQDDFRSRCILADNCALPEEDAGFDAGLTLSRWADVANLLFDVPAEVDGGFDVVMVSNLSGSTSTSNQCAYSGAVLTKEGSALCIPASAKLALEYSSEGRVSSVTVNQPDGETWSGGVLLDTGVVLGLPVTASTLITFGFRPPLIGRQVDFLPLSDIPDGGAGYHAAARTLDGTVVTVDATNIVFIRDGGVSKVPHQQMGDYAGSVLTESGRSVLLSPRSATRVLEASLRTATSPTDRATLRGGVVGGAYAGGVLLENGDALLTPAAAGVSFLRVPSDGGLPLATTAISRASLHGATWSTNGFAYALDVDGGTGSVAMINRRGEVSWTQLPSTVFGDGGVGPLSHLGFVALADGRLVSCGCQSSKVLVLTPRWRRTVPLEVMTTPWLNKW